MRESEIIERLRRVATDPAARGLMDDVALIDGLVVTHDTIAEGLHFLPADPPASVGWKLVTVNLSDLAGKGAEPLACLLSLTLAGDSEWDEAFIGGVEAACECYGLALVGGDTIGLPMGASRVLGLTAIGRAGERTPTRGGGRPGDRLWLVGTLGDSAAGLEQLRENAAATGPLVDIYRRPIPLLAAGRQLSVQAQAMMDVSDGLLLDLQRLCVASGCGALVDLDSLPLSDAFIAERGLDRAARLFAATGGDDYALLAALPTQLDPILTLCLPDALSIIPIGSLVAGAGITLGDSDGEVPLPEHLGFEHRGLSSSPMGDRS